MALSDGYQYKELPLPNYSAGVKGATRSLSRVSGGESVPNLGDSWQGGNDNGGATGSGGGGIPPGEVYVANVQWDGTLGNLDIYYSDGSQSFISFSNCP